MEYNNTLISQELEDMRKQISILKDKIEQQTIVNENHIRNSMKSKASDINRSIIIAIVGGTFALLYCPWFFYKQGLSELFIGGTVIMLAVCLILTIVQQFRLKSIDFSTGNLIDTTKDIIKIHNHYKEWYKISVPMVIIWFSWMMYEMVQKYGDTPQVIYFCAGAVFGGIIGGIYGTRLNRKVVKRTREILSQIEELKKG